MAVMTARVPGMKRLVAELRNQRQHAGLTLEGVAARVGSTASQISRIERGETENPAFTDIALLAQLYGMSGDTLLYLAGLKTEPSKELEPALYRLMVEIQAMPRGDRERFVEFINQAVLGYRGQHDDS
jgi:transcriptional regulator with XRE-family HTH domain